MAQTEEWDAALDRYARICDQCIGLRQRSLSGEAVPMASITELLSELSALRNSLQQASGSMTPLQRTRFERIRQRYTDAFERPDKAQGKMLSLPGLERMPALPVICNVPASPSVSLSFTTPNEIPELSSLSPGTPELHWGLIVFGAFPAPRPGLMGRLDFGRTGLYVKGSFYPVPEADYSCRSDGTTDTGFIWTSGRERMGMYTLSAGASYALSSMLRLFAGAGIGKKNVQWEDASGKWAKVSDLSPAGLSTEAGLLFDFRHFTLMAGVSTVSFRTISLELGAGYNF